MLEHLVIQSWSTESKALAVSRRKRDTLLNPLIEEGVDVEGMITPAPPIEEALLGGVDQGRNRGHHQPSDSGSQQAVVGVGNTYGASVRN